MRASEFASQAPAAVFEALPSTSRMFAVADRAIPIFPSAAMRKRSVLEVARPITLVAGLKAPADGLDEKARPGVLADPPAVSSLVPEANVRLPLVSVELASLRRNCVPLKPSTRS